MNSQPSGPRISAAGFSAGRVIRTTLSVVLGNIISFSAITFVVTVPVLALGAIVALVVSGEADAVLQRSHAEMPGTASLLGTGVAVGLTVLLSGLLLIASLVYGAFQALQGGHAPIGESLRHGLACVLPVLATAVVSVILLALVQVPLMFSLFAVTRAVSRGELQAVVFIVSVLIYLAFMAYVLVGFWLLVPVAVVERVGIATSLGRAWQLSRGERWQAVAVVGLSLAGTVVLFLAVAAAGKALEAAGVPPAVRGVLTLLADGMLAFGTFSYFAVLPTVGYYYLKRHKEGVEIDELVAVFE